MTYDMSFGSRILRNIRSEYICFGPWRFVFVFCLFLFRDKRSQLLATTGRSARGLLGLFDGDV